MKVRVFIQIERVIRAEIQLLALLRTVMTLLAYKLKLQLNSTNLSNNHFTHFTNSYCLLLIGLPRCAYAFDFFTVQSKTQKPSLLLCLSSYQALGGSFIRNFYRHMNMCSMIMLALRCCRSVTACIIFAGLYNTKLEYLFNHLLPFTILWVLLFSQ